MSRPRFVRCSRPLATLAVMAALVLSACGSGASGSGGETELDESKLVVYSGRQERLVQPLLDDFTRDSGIEVSVRYGDTATLAAQLLEEGERTKADLFFSQDAGALGALDKAGRLIGLPAETLDVVPPRYRADDGDWVGVSGRSRVLVYNPDQVHEADLPRSVLDLADARWSGKLGIAPTNGSFQSFVTALRVMRGDDVALSWLKALKANGVQTFDNNLAVLDATDRGVISVGLINHYYLYEKIAEVGEQGVTARLHFFPGGDPGALVNVAGVGVLAGSDQQEAAQRLVDFMLSAQAQEYFASETKEYPLRDGVPAAAGLPALSSLQPPDVDLSDLDGLAETLEMIQQAGLT